MKKGLKQKKYLMGKSQSKQQSKILYKSTNSKGASGVTTTPKNVVRSAKEYDDSNVMQINQFVATEIFHNQCDTSYHHSSCDTNHHFDGGSSHCGESSSNW